MGDVETMIDKKIAGKKVMIFSKTYCPFCTKAKEVFKKYLGKELDENEYEVMEIENDPNCGAIQDCLMQKTGGRSVPRVFVKGKCIGGGDESVALHQNGQLKALLA